MGRGRVAVALVALLLLTLFLTGGRQVWAVVISFSPNPPVAGQPFTITSSDSDDGLSVYTGSVCNGQFSITAGTGTVNVPAQSAGAYAYFDADLAVCVDFNIISAPTTTGVPHIVGLYVGDAFLAYKNYCTASPTHC